MKGRLASKIFESSSLALTLAVSKRIDCTCDCSSDITALFLIMHCAAALYRGLIVTISFITVSS